MKFMHPKWRMTNDLCASVIFHRKKFESKMNKIDFVCCLSLTMEESLMQSPVPKAVRIVAFEPGQNFYRQKATLQCHYPMFEQVPNSLGCPRAH